MVVATPPTGSNVLTLSKTYNLQDNTLVATGGNVGIGTTNTELEIIYRRFSC